ncbi:hypothetical protein HDV00_001245 [Rhizophlyctis rosea]|nr:hypothetical protein HDV00_001245 [Rhizophlyctis rosea]
MKIEHNPIQWPPADIIQCNSEEEHEREKWLKALKEYLVRHGSGGPSGADDTVGSASGVKGWLSKYLAFREERNQPCDILVETYLRDAKPLSSSTSDRSTSSERDVRVVDIARGTASALAGMYRTVRRLTNASSNKVAAQNLEREMGDLNAKVSKLVSVLKAVDDVMTSDHQGNSSSSPTGILNMHRANQTVEQRCAEVKRVVVGATGECRRVVSAVQENLKELLQGVDMRVARSLLVEWYGANAELATMFQSLAGGTGTVGGMGGGNGGGAVNGASIAVAAQMGYTPREALMNGLSLSTPHLYFSLHSSNPHTRRPSDSSLERYVVDVETVLSLARASTNAAVYTMRVLEGVLSNGVGVGGDLWSLLIGAREATMRLVETLDVAQGEREDTEKRKNFYEDAGVFIQTVVRLTNGAKTVATSTPFDADTTAAIGNLTRTTKELMIALATHGNGAVTVAPGTPMASRQYLFGNGGGGHRRVGSGSAGGSRVIGHSRFGSGNSGVG